MAVARDRPYTQFNFLVDLGDVSSAGPQAGFQEVSAIATEVAVIEYRNERRRAQTKPRLRWLAS